MTVENKELNPRAQQENEHETVPISDSVIKTDVEVAVRLTKLPNSGASYFGVSKQLAEVIIRDH
ncbi:MAG TPA: hypothetical protein VFW94_09625 [Candidatus Acidoferrales bacterium]|nr:hypothetical protein [Candidatus Acidoferrales bacterium]